MKTQLIKTIKKEEINEGFHLIYDGDFADVYQLEDTFLCIAYSPYIPIEAFKATFNEISEAIQKHGSASKFIFDIRALRSFINHQWSGTTPNGN